ncbi:DUF3592 domain-containing protein [Cryptosporangium minutisporangium]|uniref:DUF3592 domain-containing protein n=1 Tax=Cryptosporangium minutisporangium TaxID=113569 RepID=A0ABP6T2S3_9ACTN
MRTLTKRPPTPLFATLGLVVVLGFAYAAWTVWSNDRALEDRGQEATARVVEVTEKKQRIEVEFRTADGRTVRTKVGQGDEAPGPAPSAGDEIPVVYDPENPESEVRDARAPVNYRMAYTLAGTAVVGAIGTTVATIALARTNRRALR